MIMEKKKYSNPMVEIAPITTSHLLDSSMTMLPPQPVSKRRSYTQPHRTPVF